MAGTKSDGSIRIDTKLDNSGFTKGSEELKHAVRSLTNQVNTTGSRIQNAFKFDFGQPKQTVNSFSRAIKQVNDEIQSLGELGQRALEGDADALARFRSESGETLSKLEDMKAELEKFGSSEFTTPEYSKAAEQYQKAATQVDELTKSLEEAEAAFETLTNDFGRSEEYTALEDRIDVLKMYQAEYEAALKRGDSRASAMAMMDAGVGKGSIADAIKEAEAEMQKLWDKFENSTPYRSTQREIDKITEKLEAAKAQAAQYKAEMEATPATFEGYDSTEYERDQAALERTIDRLLEYRQLVREGVGNDTAPSAEWEAVQEKWQNMTTLSGIIKNAFSSVFSTISSGARTAGSALSTGITHPVQLLDRILGSVAVSARRTHSLLINLAGKAIVSGIQNIAEAAKKASVYLAKMARSAIPAGLKKLGNAISGVGKQSKRTNVSLAGGFKTILKYGLGIRSLYVLFNKLRTAITDGFGTLAKYDSQFNQTMSNFKNSLERLKNSFAGAFAPLAEAVLPVITAVIDKVSAFLSKLGQFFAALTGKDYFMEATKGTTDYADSLDKSSKKTKKQNKESKELERTLAGFDDVEILKENKNKDDDDEEEPDTHGGFNRIPISGAMSDLANKLRDYLKGLFDVFKQAWAQEGEKVLASMRNALNAVKTLLGDIAKTFYRVFTDGYGFDWLVSIFQLLETIFDIIAAIATEFDKAWNDNDRGYKYLAAMFTLFTTINNILRDIGQAFLTAWNDGGGYALCASFLEMFTNIYNLLTSIGEAFRSAWNTGIGVEIFTNILSIMTEINNIVGNLAASFQRGWEEAGNGEKVWLNILEIINTVLSSINKAVTATAEWANGLNFSPLIATFDTVLEAIKPVVDIITSGLAWAWENILLPFGKWTIEEALPAMLEALASAFDVLSAALEALSPILSFLWDNIIKPFGETVGSLVVEALRLLTEKLNGLADWISKNQESFRTIVEVIGSFVVAWASASIVSGIITAITSAATLLVSGLAALAGAFNPVVLIMGAVIAIGVLLYKNWDTIKEKAGELWKAISDFFGKIGDAIGTAFSAALDLGSNLVEGLKKGITDFFSDPLGWIKENIVDKFIDAIKNLFGIASPSTVMQEIGGYVIEGLLQGIIDFFSDPIGWVDEHIFGPFMDAINSLFGLDGEESILFSAGASLLNSFMDGMASIASTIGSWIEENIVGPIQSAFDWISEAWNNFWGNSDDQFSMPAMEGAKATTDAYRDALTNLAETMDDTTAWDNMSTAMWDMYQKGLLNSGTMEGLQNIMFDVANTGEPFAEYTDRIAWLLEQSGVSAEAFNEALGYTPGAVESAAGSMEEMGQKAETAGDKTSAVGDALDTLNGMDLATSIKVALISAAISSLESTSSLANDKVSGLKQALEEYKTNPTEQSMERLKTAFEDAGVSADDFKIAFMKAIAEADDQTKREMLSIVKTMQDSGADIKNSGDTAGKNLGDGLTEGMESKEKDVSSEAGKLISDSVLQTMDNAADSHSPSKETHKRGVYLIEGLVEGMKSVSNTVSTSADTIIKDALRTVENYRGQFNSIGSALIQEMQNGMNSMSGSISSAANNLSIAITNSFNSQNWYELGNNIGQGIYNGLVANSGSLQALAWNTAVEMYNSACRALSIASPSKKFAWIGEMITKGLGGGIEDTQDTAVNAVTSLADAVTQEAEGTNPIMQIDTAVSGLDGVLSTFSDKVIRSFDMMISAMEDIVNGSSLTMPAIANGSVTPYSARRAVAQDEGDKLSSLIETLSQRDAGRLTRDDLNEVLVNVLRQYLNIDFYIGDEQIARHANAGNARLNRRYSALT